MVSSPSLSSNALGLELVESMWIEFAIISGFIIARFYTKIYLVRRIGWDDWIMLAAFFVNLGAFIINQLAVNNGFGMHAYDLTPGFVMEAVKWAFLGQVLGIMAAAIARMAFITTLAILLAPAQKVHRWLLRGFWVVQLLLNTITALYILFQCRPTRGLWDHTIGAKCLPPYMQEHLGFFQASVNSFTDMALAILPATIIWKLNMRPALKFQLCVTMGLGVFACIASVIKTVKLTEINGAPNDLTNVLWGIQFWFCIEDTTIIVAATVPSLRALFTRSHSKADRQTSPYVSNQSKDRRWNNVWNKKKTSLRMDTSVSDQIELTSANNRNFGVGPSTSYIVNVNGGKVGESFDNPPERGIMKTSTMNAYSEEA